MSVLFTMYKTAPLLACLLMSGHARRVAFAPSSPGVQMPLGRPSFMRSHAEALIHQNRCPQRVQAEPRHHQHIMMSDPVRDNIRNIAIVAHVDHGKTTLVDSLLEEDLQKTIGKDDRLMDGNDQERERGITILAKNAAIQHEGIKVNIVDTPGHADFGGEVERVLGMVDGVLLVVDAQEGPKPQTRFVLKKALAMGHKIMVVINKIDKPAARPDYVIDKTFDLFCELGASDEQTEFEVVYSSAVNRQSGPSPEDLGDSMKYMKDEILKLPKPVAMMNDPLQLQISNVGSDQFIGRLGVGRIRSGTVEKGKQIAISAGPGETPRNAKISELFVYDAMGRTPVDSASAGDIVVFAGIQDFNIGDTLVDPADPKPLDPIEVETPTMAIVMGVNTSPLAGKSSAKKLTSREIRERLNKELEVNVALKVVDSGSVDDIQVYGRGLLHLTVLIESMRREGFEVMVGPPKVIEKEVDGERMEPFELVDIELPEEYSGSVIDMLSQRKGSMIEMSTPTAEGMQTLQYSVPTRGMVGVKSKVLTVSRGLAVMTSTFEGYKPYAGDFPGRDRGNLLADADGEATSFALQKCQERGDLFINPKDAVYKDMIIGINSRPVDLPFNICKEKKLTNMRASGKDENVNLVVPKPLTLEDAVEYVIDGEFVEVTPESIRMGKRPKQKTMPKGR